jgi:putative transposase
MSTIALAYRFALDLNDRQATVCAQHAGLARKAWNWALGERNERWEKNEGKDRFISCYDQQKAWVAQKPAWAYKLSAWAAVSAIEDLDAGFKAFWKGRKEKHRVGLPRFKVKSKCRDSFRLRGSIRVEPTRVKLPVLGCLRIKGSASRFRADKICYATVSREAAGWFVSITVEQERTDPIAPIGAPVGLDLGITHFATLSDGTVIDAPKPLKAALRKLRREQKALSRSQKASAGRKRRVARIARTHARVRSIRRDFLHRTSHAIATSHVAVGVEKLATANLLKNRKLSRAISDLGWGEFLRQLAYKAVWSGSTLVVADRFYKSTKMCSNCGALVDMPLSQRIYRCAACGLVLDRDLNSARNLCPVAVTPTETLNASGGNVSPGTAWQILVKLEPSPQILVV